MPDKDRQKMIEILKKIRARDFSGLDFKKLAGRDDIYRVRHGDFRIIFHLIRQDVNILTVEKRDHATYNF